MAQLSSEFRLNLSNEAEVMSLAKEIAGGLRFDGIIKKLTGKDYSTLSPDQKILFLENVDLIHGRIAQFTLGVAPAPTNSAPSGAPQPAGEDPNVNKQVITTKGNVANFESYNITADDYFNKHDPTCTTVLTSEIAAMKRVLELLRDQEIFTDPDFNPDTKGAKLLYHTGAPPAAGYTNPSDVEWMRPREWSQTAKFFSGGISSNDVVQGALGDCWFIGALSVLATRDELLTGSIKNLSSPDQIKTIKDVIGLRQGVYPPMFHAFAKKGLYVLRFFVSNGWKYVILDDKLPMLRGGQQQYIFAHCLDANELWVPLIEKAYAKLFGCYEALNSGLIDDALVDMTGLVAEKLKMKDFNTSPAKLAELWEIISKYRQNKTLMGCSIEGHTEGEVRWDGERTGLLSGHAYSLVDVLRFEERSGPDGLYRLLRIRNPWGRMEWCGPWANGSADLSDFKDQVMVEVNKLGPDEKFDPNDRNDGTFLMELLDWSEIYHNLFSCVDFPDEWSGVRFVSAWTSANSGGVPRSQADFNRWATNPQFIMELQSTTEIFLSLQQEDGRLIRGMKFPYEGQIKAVCFAISELGNEPKASTFNQQKIKTLSTVKPHREVSKRISLPAGRYAIVPALMQAGETADFTLAVYFSCPKTQIQLFSADNKSDTGSSIKAEEEVKIGRAKPDMQAIKGMVASLAKI